MYSALEGEFCKSRLLGCVVVALTVALHLSYSHWNLSSEGGGTKPLTGMAVTRDQESPDRRRRMPGQPRQMSWIE